MREILFRGKAYDGKWLEGMLTARGKKVAQIGTFSDYGTHICCKSSYAVIPRTVGQYTGLTDKNGKKVFEGDIVKCVALGNDHFQKGTKAVSVVENYMGNTCLRLDGKYLTGVTLYTISVDHTVEVIGNIHDNPELLGGVKNG